LYVSMLQSMYVVCLFICKLSHTAFLFRAGAFGDGLSSSDR